MKSLEQMRTEQQTEVEHYRAVADHFVSGVIRHLGLIVGVLLAGSVARGDARRGPYGLYIDLVLVAEDRKDVDLTAIFGPSIEPFIPKHCVKYEDTGIAIELTTSRDLLDIRNRWEPEIYARQESIILYDKTGFLHTWKDSAFAITEEQKRDRALYWFFRYDYLVGNYRFEKWKHRSAWVQMSQNGNEAVECYCNFLYCINGWFIPRKDWLVYLTFELRDIIPDHGHILEKVYSSAANEKDQTERFKKLFEILVWMGTYCKEKKWADLPDPIA